MGVSRSGKLWRALAIMLGTAAATAQASGQGVNIGANANANAAGNSQIAAPNSEMILPPDAVADRDLVFASRNGQDLRLDLFRPPGKGPFPLIIWIHGGGWETGDKNSYPHMNFLVGKGYAVANIEYRLSQVATFPAQLEDSESALDFLNGNATRYEIDVKRIVVSGESAGGHLAALVGLDRSARVATPADAKSAGRVRGVIDLAGPSDLTVVPVGDSGELAQHVERLLGGSGDERIRLAKDASPIWQVSANAPAFLIVHGTADPIVPFSQSQRLADALRKAGADVELEPIPNAGHVGPAFWTPDRQQELLSFLQRVTRASN